LTITIMVSLEETERDIENKHVPKVRKTYFRSTLEYLSMR